MRKIENCFFCTTPYQIMAAIAIVKQLGETSDLYIVNQFANADEYQKSISKENLFSEIRVIDESKYKYKENRGKFAPLIWAKTTSDLLKLNEVGKQILIKNTEYKKLYVSSRFLIGELIYQYFQKNEIEIERLIFDDGVGSYIDNSLLTLSPGFELTERVILNAHEIKMLEPNFLFCPELYFKLNSNSNQNIMKIENCYSNTEMLDVLNRIFLYNKSNCINEKVILLDFIKERNLGEGGLLKTSEVYTNIFHYFGLENVIIKKHPRDKEGEKEGINYYKDSQIPFECLCANMDCSRKIFISLSSTAVITPKLLFNQEPNIILLYKIIRYKGWNEQKINRMDLFFRGVKEIYDDSKRIFIPENLEELDFCLKEANSLIEA